ncbi:MAG TPA: PQQ-binding-like beta-propeller repeat protein [Solirubrobacteraceae bacterium]|nr:PQQ-binding-like beta-propeller repeat protein [Solirubrobacteraceae bacterium]
MRSVASLLSVVACGAAVALAGCGSSGPAIVGPGPDSSSAYTGTTSATSARARIPEAAWLQFDYDAHRDGVGPAATGITAGNVHRLKLRTVRLPGTVDSSAIELAGVTVRGRRRDVIVMTTTYGRTIALDPGSGRRLWEFTPADIQSYLGSPQITTSTPIADPGGQFVYAASPDGRIHKLSLATGREVRSGGWPVRVTFDPTHEKIASPLNISGGSLIVVTDGYIGDAPPYQGHVVTIAMSSGRITAVWNSLCSNRHTLINPPSSCPGSDSAIWGRNAPVIEPGTGRILVATGNGPFNGSTYWGDSVLELSPDGSTLLHNWTPTDQAQLNSGDQDLGSTSPAVLPVYQGRRLAVQGGKAGVLDLLDLDRLDGTTGGAGPRLGGQIQQLSSPGGDQVFTAPAVWSHNGRIWVFVGDGSGTWAYTLGGSGAAPRLSVAWKSGNGGTSPVIAGGLLYVYDPGGSLDIYEPTTGRRLVSLPAGSGHWNSPIVVGGRVILPVGNANDHSTSGTLDIYHLPGR